jgi:hypothetical protein
MDFKEQADSFTDKIGALSKYVVSTELKEAPWGVWEPATIIKDDVFEEIHETQRTAWQRYCHLGEYDARTFTPERRAH